MEEFQYWITQCAVVSEARRSSAETARGGEPRREGIAPLSAARRKAELDPRERNGRRRGSIAIWEGPGKIFTDDQGAHSLSSRNLKD